MSKKKIISFIVLAGIIITSGTIVLKNTDILKHIESAKAENNIKLMNYKPAKKVNTSGFQVDKYDKTNIAGLINDNEVLTLTTKDVPKKTVIPTNENYYCSIYNLNTKNKKDFKDVNISNFYGLSPDKKYALYMGPVYVSKETPEETKKAQQRGSLYHGLKVLNLFTGQITTLIPDHSNGEFKWISNDKVWASFFTGWQIIGIDGKVYASGDYPVKGNDSAWTVGADIKDSGDIVEGKIYYTELEDKPINVDLQSMDIKTKEIKDLFSNKNSLHASKQGHTIAMDNYVDHGEKSPGIYDRTFGTIILDENGQLLRNIDLPDYGPNNFVISPDGTKAAYIEQDNSKNTANSSNTEQAPVDLNNIQSTLKIIDIKTGATKEIIKCPYISNIIWNNTGDSLSFTSGRPYILEKSIDAKNMIKFSATRNENIDSYVITFDK
ncbi:hypothetical protein [Clostridium pasteurianum]|uniref:Periplasmic component of the Tol biopolymer transport system n=1 Tax=Clostridium pasteurianum BC1 TaxID=86416 RepID=R4K793_CLOPA|nr:hypothetical protein [Clostridium pasteurianum]AGK98443.1 hypothetical protein Clopa_3661 [Clostridium pasteurianum BC1]